jgi:hypothetical protein
MIVGIILCIIPFLIALVGKHYNGYFFRLFPVGFLSEFISACFCAAMLHTVLELDATEGVYSIQAGGCVTTSRDMTIYDYGCIIGGAMFVLTCVFGILIEIRFVHIIHLKYLALLAEYQMRAEIEVQQEQHSTQQSNQNIVVVPAAQAAKCCPKCGCLCSLFAKFCQNCGETFDNISESTDNFEDDERTD